MSCDFATTVPAKWILSGEHAVLRGHPALVFPMQAFRLHCQYSQNPNPLQVLSQGKPNTNLQSLVLNLYAKARIFLKRDTESALCGKLEINTDIPIGQGMGASAALCVAIARWLVFLGYCPKTEIAPLAHELEHHFHGKSSGLDIAGVAANEGVWFHSGNTSLLDICWQPKVYLSNTGMPGITTDCIRAVSNLALTDPERAIAIDTQMAEASCLAKAALNNANPDQRLQDLAIAIDRGRDCFINWQLYSPSMHEHEAALRKMGALAVKPTGSGKGGCFISLWTHRPPEDSKIRLHSLFA